MGVDAAALAEQIREKEEAKKMEKERERALDSQMIAASEHAREIEEKIRLERKEMEKDMNGFRTSAQAKETRREFDLSDPSRLKKDSPARVSDVDEHLGPASMQVFEGEDLSASQRLKKQQEQMRKWVEDSTARKMDREMKEKEALRLFEMSLEEVNFMASGLEDESQKSRKEVAKSVEQFNLQMAKDRKSREEAERKKDLEDSLHDVESHLKSDVLTESFDATISAVDPLRFRPDHFKGLRPDQYEKIEEIRRKQLEEKSSHSASEMEEERRREAESEQCRRSALLIEREIARQRREVEGTLAAEQKKQAEEKKARVDALYHGTYANRVDESFFDQFGKSCR